MAPRTAQDPNELVKVVWSATGQKVELPRRLINTGSKAAQERYLIGSGQIPDLDAPLLPPTVAEVVDEVVADRQAAAFSAVEQLRQQLDELQGKLAGQPLSHAELVAARQEITALMLKAADAGAQLVQVEGRGSQIKAELTAIATPLNEQAAETARQQKEHEQVQQRVLDDLQMRVAAMLQSLSQDAAAALAETEQEALSKAAEIARQQVGPMGPAGSSTVLSLEDPLEVAVDSFSARWLGRDLIDGDGVLVIKPDQILVRRWVGGTWREGPAIQPKVVREDVKVSALNTGNAVYPVMASAAAGGSGGSGLADPLTVSIIPKGGSVAVADSSRWQAGGYDTFSSGIVHLEFVPNQGSMGGRHHFVTASFVLLAGTPDTFKVTEFSVLGAGFEGGSDVFDVTFNGAIGAATAPGSLGIALPAGTANASRIFVTITAADPATRDFTIKGNVIWTPEAATGAQLPNLPVRKQPAWLLVS